MYEESCKLFREADELFNDKFVDGGKFNDNSGLYYDYCPQKNGSKSCNTDYEKIGAIGGYIFMELYNNNSRINGSNNSDRFIEYFIIWISHKLYKITTNHSASLNATYENYLGKSIGNYKFWNLTQNKNELKSAKIAIMNMFYVLFKQICETIKTYQTKDIQAHEFISKGIESKIIYDQLSQFVNQCGPYVEVLDHLKTIYNDLIETAEKEEIHGTYVFDTLTKFPSIDNTNAGSELKGKECKQVHRKLIKNPPRFIKNEIKKLKNIIERNLQKGSNSESSTLVTPQAQDDTTLTNPQSGLYILAIPSEDEEEDDDDDDGDNDGDDDGDDDANGDDDDISDDDYSDGEEDDNLGSTEDTKDRTMDQLQQNVPLQPNSQDKTQDSQKEIPPIPVPAPQIHPQPESEPQPQHQPQPESQQQKGDQLEPPQPPTSEPGSEKDQKTSDTSPKDPSSEQKDSGNMNFQNIFSSVKNTFKQYGASAYKTITNAGNTLYEKASSTLENVYDKSKNFASNTISYVNEQLNKALDNRQPSKDTKIEPDPSLPEGKKPEQNIQTPIPGGQSNDDPQVPPPAQNLGSTDSKQLNPSDSTPEKQSQPSVDPRSKTPSLTIETGNTGSIVKEHTPQLIKIKNIYRGYNRPRIVITVILIPIILLIVYKYLSSVWRKESKRKKNMKKIINSIGGKRPVQIIIKSSSRKKQIKKSINFAYREKSSLLNIYKLMQADPVPFINLFFLLIFFVYKRKLNYLEL